MPSVTNSANAKSTGSVASLSFSHISDGNPLYVHIGLWNNLSGSPRRTRVTFNSVAMDCVAVSSGGTQWVHEVWYLASPGSVTANVVITPIGSNTWISAASNNVSGGTRPDHFVFATGTSTTPSAAIPSAVGDLVLDLVSSDATSQTWMQGAGQTLIGSNTSANSDVKCANSSEAGAASVTMSWTLGASDAWGLSAFNIPASASTVDIVQSIHDPDYSVVTGSSKTLTFNANTAAGNVIVVCLQYPIGSGIATLSSVTDSQGNTYDLVDTFIASSRVIQQWLSRNIVGGACTVTMTYSGNISTYQSALELSSVGGVSARASAETTGTSQQAGTATSNGAGLFIESSALSTGIGGNAASDGFMPIRTEGQMVIHVRPVGATTSSAGPYTTASLTSENLLVVYGAGTTIRGSAVFGERTTVSATRAIAFGLDGNTNTLSEAGKFKVFGKGEFTDTLTVIDPVNAQDAVSKTYCDGKSTRGRVRAATTANITISTALNNGDSLDGVTLATGDLVLVKNQSTAADNGVYVVGASPARAGEYDTYNEHPGSLIAVQEGTTNADTLWLCTSDTGGTLNTTAIAFTQVAATSISGQYGSLTYDAGNSSTALTLDWNNGNTQLVTLTGNCTFTLSNPKDGFRYLIVLKQDGTGSRTVTWPSAVKWQAGTAPTLSTTAGKADLVTLVWMAGLGASGNYLAAANTDYTPA